MKQSVGHLTIIVLIAATVFFTNLGTTRLWDRDEPRNAGCAVEMMHRGDMVVPIFNDELRHQKPVLLYWLMMSAYSVFGINEFSARFWSALLGLGTILMVYVIARRLFDSAVAFWSSVVLTTSIMFCVASRVATPDSALIFFSTLAMTIFVLGTFAPRRDQQPPLLRHAGHWFPQNIWVVVAMNAAMGLGVLTKGPAAMVLPTAIIGMFLLIMRLPAGNATNRTWWSAWVGVLRPFHPLHFLKTCLYMRPLTAIGVVLLIAAPWYVLVGIRTDGDFNKLFFLTENFGRATNVFENHRGGPWYYPIAILAGFFPWSVFVVPVGITFFQAFRHEKSDEAGSHRGPLIFLLCWVGVQVGLFSLAQTKLPSYVTPCYPALAMLTAFALRSWITNRSSVANWWYALAYLSLGLSGIGICAGLGFVANELFAEKWWLALFGLVPILGAVFALIAWWQCHWEKSVCVFATTAVVLCVLIFGFGTVAVDSTRQTELVLAPLKAAPKGQAVAAFGCLESSWIYYSQKPIYELDLQPQAAESTDTLVRTATWKRKPRICPEHFVAIHRDAMIITTDQHLAQLQKRLPENYQVDESVNFFLRKERKLILLRPNKSEPDMAKQPGVNRIR